MTTKQEELLELVNDFEMDLADLIELLSFKEIDKLIAELSEELINSKSGRTP